MGSNEVAKAINWQTDVLDIRIVLDENSAPCLDSIHPRGKPCPEFASPYFTTASVPLDAIRAAGQGQGLYKTAKSLVGSVLSARLRYTRHVEHESDVSKALDIVCYDEETGLEVTHRFEVFKATSVLRSWTTVKNTSGRTQTLNQVSSLAIGGVTAGTEDWYNGYTLLTANNTWFRELQWQERSLPDVGIDEIGLHALRQGHKATMASFSLSNRGAMTTETHIPMGALKRKDDDHTWLWQIESGGSWRWEIGDWQDGLYLVAGGPTLVDHAWQLDLAPGTSFTSPPVAVCRTDGGVENAFAAMNEYRRCIVRPNSDHEGLPIIFNDYMNCLMGDPNEDKIKALLKPAVQCGAEYYVIDAGWYADEVDVDWWDDVGEWEPSSTRFPSGFKTLIDEIRNAGLLPGVWLEPEVIGVRSVAARELPDAAFFQEKGRRVEERRRYQLDFTHPAVRERMHRIVAGLVQKYGILYFKFDYNIDVLTGSDAHEGLSTGAAHFEHQRAYITWIEELFSRHPGLVVENCASGGQRMEYGMLATHTLQSTSDQQDPFLYAAVAAAAPTAVLPQQSASWAYPQRAWSDEKNAFTVVNSLMGRVHLSGRLDALTSQQLELVKEGMQVYCSIRKQLVKAKPFWPLGLPAWRDDWVSLGMLTEDGIVLLAVWRRSGATSMRISLQGKGRLGRVKVLYPATFETRVKFSDDVLEIDLPDTPCARLLQLEV
ncbi:glycoside hydrolase family 36 protein [Periconia macrospinosa]|uniref:alpha-galactosidase n=1 Tax=Periconia macrospinosa TaxID=97972 RepID=A0A2V1DL52_9PLEO|nr:glycoside hydrolase family 36 protein [Periconia macrospinosa]